jgi:hypothetical protein
VSLSQNIFSWFRSPPTHNRRIAVALGVACLSAAYVALVYSVQPPGTAADFDQWWIGAHALRQGKDPYLAVAGSGWSWPLFYPLPAVLCAVPFTVLPLPVARSAFVALGAFVLAYAVTWRVWWPLVLFTSGAWLATAVAAQWTPFLVAGALLPVVGVLYVVKPNIALASWIYRPSWIPVVGGLVLVGLSFIVWPSWGVAWWAAIKQSPYVVAPIMRPGGFLLLLALLRWRRQEARLLASIAFVPHTILPQEALILFLVPASYRETAALSLLTSAAVGVAFWVGEGRSYGDMLARAWPGMLLLVYLPVLWMVLRRPNEGSGSDPVGRA